MSSLVEGCKDLSDVNEKKTDFFEFLKRNGIFEETSPSISSEENHLYNIINLEIIEEISKEFECDISKNITILNYISVLRKDSNLNNFYNIAYLLLTGNSRTTRVAWHNKVKEEGNVPLATNLNWITNKFWFKLNKGFSKDAFPKSLDIITKAQTTLSSILNDSIGIKFDELKEQFAKGEITEEQTKARLVNLRRQAIKPENIKQDEVKSILSTISEDSLERFVRDHEISKNEVHKKNQENIKLKAELEEKEREIIHTESARNKAEENLFNTSLSSLKMLLKEKNEVVILLEKQKRSFDKIIKNQILFHKVILASFCVFYYIITFGLIYKYSWNQMEQWTYILNSAMPIILFFLYSLFFEKNLNPIEYVPLKREHITKKVYNQFNFDITKLHTLKREVTELEEKIMNTNNT